MAQEFIHPNVATEDVYLNYKTSPFIRARHILHLFVGSQKSHRAMMKGYLNGVRNDGVMILMDNMQERLSGLTAIVGTNQSGQLEQFNKVKNLVDDVKKAAMRLLQNNPKSAAELAKMFRSMFNELSEIEKCLNEIEKQQEKKQADTLKIAIPENSQPDESQVPQCSEDERKLRTERRQLLEEIMKLNRKDNLFREEFRKEECNIFIGRPVNGTDMETFETGANANLSIANGIDLVYKIEHCKNDGLSLLKDNDVIAHDNINSGENPISSMCTDDYTKDGIYNYHKQVETRGKGQEFNEVNHSSQNLRYFEARGWKIEDPLFVQNISMTNRILKATENNNDETTIVEERVKKLREAEHSLVYSMHDTLQDMIIEKDSAAAYIYVYKGKEIFYFAVRSEKNAELFENWRQGEAQENLIIHYHGSFQRLEITEGAMLVLPPGCLYFAYALEDTVLIKGNFHPIGNLKMIFEDMKLPQVPKIKDQSETKQRRPNKLDPPEFAQWIFLYVECVFNQEFKEEDKVIGKLIHDELEADRYFKQKAKQGWHTKAEKIKVLSDLCNHLNSCEGLPEAMILERPPGDSLEVNMQLDHEAFAARMANARREVEGEKRLEDEGEGADNEEMFDEINEKGDIHEDEDEDEMEHDEDEHEIEDKEKDADDEGEEDNEDENVEDEDEGEDEEESEEEEEDVEDEDEDETNEDKIAVYEKDQMTNEKGEEDHDVNMETM